MKAKRLPPLRQMMDHQNHAVEYGIKAHHPAFFMEMRLGKTLTAIRWIKALGPTKRPVLVVVPPAVVETWARELIWEREKYVITAGLDPVKRDEYIGEAWAECAANRQRTWVISTYPSILADAPVIGRRIGRNIRNIPALAKLPWHAVILDESPEIKNPTAQTTKVFVQGFRRARHRAILSGLPTPEGDLDIYSQMQFLDGEFMRCSDFYHFRSQNFWRRGYLWLPQPGQHAEIKQAIHNRAFVLRRRDVGMKAKKVYERRYVDMTQEQAEHYASVMKDFEIRLKNKTIETAWATTRYIWASQIAGGCLPHGKWVSRSKMAELVSLLKGELSGTKVVVWFAFRAELVEAEQMLQSHGINTVRIWGGMSLTQHRKATAAFWGRTRVILVTEDTLKYGKDLSCSSTAIYYSNSMSTTVRAQTEERIWHPHKDDTCLFLDLITRGTFQETQLDALLEKVSEAKMFMRLMAGKK